MEIIHAVIAKALDGLYVRQAATAQNIANAGSDQYTRLEVTFEGALRDALTAGTYDPMQTLEKVAHVDPAIIPVGLGGSNDVQIDQEIASASETSARYALLIGMLDRSLQLNQLAIRGG